MFKTLAGDGFQTLQTGGGYYGASRPAGREENEFIKNKYYTGLFWVVGSLPGSGWGAGGISWKDIY